MYILSYYKSSFRNFKLDFTSRHLHGICKSHELNLVFDKEVGFSHVYQQTVVISGLHCTDIVCSNIFSQFKIGIVVTSCRRGEYGLMVFLWFNMAVDSHGMPVCSAKMAGTPIYCGLMSNYLDTRKLVIPSHTTQNYK